MESNSLDKIMILSFPQAPCGFDTCKACFCPMIAVDKKEICLWCEIHGNIPVKEQINKIY